MTTLELAILALAGVAAGFLNVMAGGGSMLTVPIMLFLGVPGPVANGTNRIALLAQNLTAVITFFRRGFADFKLSLSLAVWSLPGAVAGALLGTRLEGVWFNRTLAVVMLIVMVLMATRRGEQPAVAGTANRPTRRQLQAGQALMLAVGFWGGFIQIGVGFLIMPVLHRVMGFDLLHTNVHKVFIVATYTVVALAIFASRVEILWLVGLTLAVGYSIGAWFAARVQIRRGEGLIRVVLYLVLTAFIIRLLWFS